MLTDYLAAEHFAGQLAPAERMDVIVYNPKKGKPVIDRLRRRLPHIRFQAIENLTKAQVSKLLASAKIYAHFGHHPGKDRMPREAAMAGCCVVTGRRSAAANTVDIPIPEFYKLDERSAAMTEDFARLVTDVFTNYGAHRARFDHYRESVAAEQDVFVDQVKCIVST